MALLRVQVGALPMRALVTYCQERRTLTFRVSVLSRVAGVHFMVIQTLQRPYTLALGQLLACNTTNVQKIHVRCSAQFAVCLFSENQEPVVGYNSSVLLCTRYHRENKAANPTNYRQNPPVCNLPVLLCFCRRHKKHPVLED